MRVHFPDDVGAVREPPKCTESPKMPVISVKSPAEIRWGARARTRWAVREPPLLWEFRVAKG